MAETLGLIVAADGGVSQFISLKNLENCRGGNSSVSSNLTASAIPHWKEGCGAFLGQRCNMAYPKHKDIEEPLLLLIYEGGSSIKSRDSYYPLAKHFNLTETEFSKKLDTRDGKKWDNMVQWARNELRKKGFIDTNSPRGIWHLTERGKQRAEGLLARDAVNKIKIPERGHITAELIGELYYFAKKIHEGRISRKDALSTLRMSPNSARMYFNAFRQMRHGEAYHHTMNTEGTEYFLKHIHYDYGIRGLQSALQAVDRHLHYYALHKKSRLPSIRALWEKYSAIVGNQEMSTIAEDVENIVSDTAIDTTTRQTLIEARIGQGKFRRDVMTRWANACAFSGCTTEAVLRASHIKPWRKCTNKERLDPENGLLLSANIDALFDRGLISFGDDGCLHVSNDLPNSERELLNLKEGRLRGELTAKTKVYLAYHRKKFSFNL